jgi:hypothetical protein
MNYPLAQDQIPNPPAIVTNLGKYSAMAGAVATILNWATQQTRYLQTTIQNIKNQLNTQVQGVGAALASAATITISSAIHHVTGVAAISTINAPTGFSGPIWLVADGAFAITTGGNIALARGPFTVGQVVMIVFDPSTSLWYPA